MAILDQGTNMALEKLMPSATAEQLGGLTAPEQFNPYPQAEGVEEQPVGTTPNLSWLQVAGWIMQRLMPKMERPLGIFQPGEVPIGTIGRGVMELATKTPEKVTETFWDKRIVSGFATPELARRDVQEPGVQEYREHMGYEGTLPPGIAPQKELTEKILAEREPKTVSDILSTATEIWKAQMGFTEEAKYKQYVAYEETEKIPEWGKVLAEAGARSLLYWTAHTAANLPFFPKKKTLPKTTYTQQNVPRRLDSILARMERTARGFNRAKSASQQNKLITQYLEAKQEWYDLARYARQNNLVPSNVLFDKGNTIPAIDQRVGFGGRVQYFSDKQKQAVDAMRKFHQLMETEAAGAPAQVAKAPAEFTQSLKGDITLPSGAVAEVPTIMQPTQILQSGMSQSQASKALQPLVNTLISKLGAIPKDEGMVISQELKKGWETRIIENINSFIDKTLRVERIIESLDGYEKYGDFWKAIYSPINEAVTNKLGAVISARHDLKDVLTQQNLNLKDLMTKTSTIQNVTFTTSERIGIYLLSQNDKQLNHLRYGNKFPMPLIDAVHNSITPQEKAVGDFLSSVFRVIHPLSQEAEKIASYGKTEVKTEENYYPIRRETSVPWIRSGRISIKNEKKYQYASKWAVSRIKRGFIRPRRKGANYPIIYDAVRLFDTEFPKQVHQAYFRVPARGVEMILNNAKFKDAMISKHGESLHKLLTRWLNDSAATDPMGAEEQFTKWIRHLRTSAVLAVLGFNVVTAMKQFPSFFIGAAEVGELATMKGMVKTATNWRETEKLIKRLSPQIYARKMEREIAEIAAMRDVVGRLTGRWSARQIFMAFTTGMDRLVVYSLWRGKFDDYLNKNPNASDGEAAREAERAIRKTQPFFSMKDLPELWRGTGESREIKKIFTMFQNQLNQYWNYLSHDVYGAWRAGKLSTVGATRKVIEGFIIPALLIGLIARSRPAKNAKEYITDLALTGFGSIPLAGSIITSAMKGYTETSTITLEGLDRAQRAIYHLNKGEFDKLVMLMPETLGFLVGLPVSQSKRTITALVNLAQGKSDDWLELIWGQYTRDKSKEDSEKTKSILPGIPTIKPEDLRR